jgi:hypothetical protein
MLSAATENITSMTTDTRIPVRPAQRVHHAGTLHVVGCSASQVASTEGVVRETCARSSPLGKLEVLTLRYIPPSMSSLNTLAVSRLLGKRPTADPVSTTKNGLASNRNASVFAPAGAAWNSMDVTSPLREEVDMLKETKELSMGLAALSTTASVPLEEAGTGGTKFEPDNWAMP